jgi:holdfast attachment protein HfaA
MTHVVKKSRFVAAVAFVAACAAGGQAAAQTMTTNSASFNGGWGRIQGTENHAIDVSTRDANGNRVIVDGVILDGASDTFTQTDNSGAGNVYSGAGGRSRWSSATAIGNNLQVITQGNYNTVIVNSTQINNGNVTATNNSNDSLNGELDLND